MNQFLTSLLAGLLVAITTAMGAIGTQGGPLIQAQSANQGYITVAAPQTEKKVKVLVEKDGQRATYNLPTQQAAFALPLGSGTYTVRLMENVEGNKYRELSRESVNAKLDNEQVVFLNSVQEVNWTKENQAIKKAAELTKGLRTDMEKVQAVYQFVAKSVVYDFEKAKNVKSSYLPDIENIYDTKTGICYDYSALTAAMLRSLGIPTKLVKGTASTVNGYHAWNQVFVDGKWQTIDTTVDAPSVQAGKKVAMFKDASAYKVESET